MDNLLLTIQSNGTVYKPVVEEGIQWTTERKGVPGKLIFNVMKDSGISFQEGDIVKLVEGQDNIFFGFIFTKKRDKNQNISVTAYDQLRYLKNKDTYVYSNKTASEFLKMIASDFRLNTGNIEDTPYIIPRRRESDATLFDMLQNALDLTLQSKKKMYVLYDDFGKLNLKDIENMKLDFIINQDNAEDYDYTSSIDGQTYNKIKLAYENKETGKRDIYIAQHSENMNHWGVLQYFESIEENTNGKLKADTLLELYNKKTRNLSVSNVIGDNRVRAGSSVIVNLNLGDITVQNYMVAEKVKHTYKKDLHLMDLTLRGGEFIA